MKAELLDKVLLFLERVLPGLLGAFGLGYAVASAKIRKTEKKLNQAVLEKELAENEAEVQKNLGSLSDDDVIRRAIESGRRSTKS